jgi:N-acyl-D-aspartate/D-glutamate deacylase
MLDLVLRNGWVVDGSGAPAQHADIGVVDGRVVEVGQVDDGGRREIELDGLVVAPGFVDLHTHYDAQVFWDPLLSPSPSHGVTTVISGNCGLTLAPMKPENQEFAVRLLANVEGIPVEAITSGVDFAWKTFPEMMSRLDTTPLGINLGLMVGHSAIRRHVMGPAASADGATEEQLSEMCRILDEALSVGGFGFSTATAPTHRDGDGCLTPPNFATAEEFIALSQVCQRHPGTALEFIARTSQQGFDDADTELMASMSSAANRILNWNTPVINKEDPTLHLRQLAACRMDAASNVCIVPMMMSQNHPLYYDLRRGYVHRTLPGWGWLFDLDIRERVNALRDPGVRQRLREGLEGPSVSSTSIRLRRWEFYEVVEVGPKDMQGLKGQTIGDIARARGTDAYTTWMDLLVESEFDIGYAIAFYPGEDRWVTETRKEFLSDAHVLVGASDGGAHMDMLVGGSSALRTLIEWVYQRQEFSLESMVHLLTDVPARLYGLEGKGRLQAGYAADLVVLNPEHLGVSPMRVARDLPADSPRLLSNASGVERVVVGGTDVYVDDVATGEMPGRLLRSGRDSRTVTPAEWIRSIRPGR